MNAWLQNRAFTRLRSPDTPASCFWKALHHRLLGALADSSFGCRSWPGSCLASSSFLAISSLAFSRKAFGVAAAISGKKATLYFATSLNLRSRNILPQFGYAETHGHLLQARTPDGRAQTRFCHPRHFSAIHCSRDTRTRILNEPGIPERGFSMQDALIDADYQCMTRGILR